MCKKSITNSQPFVKKWKNVRSPRGGGFFLTHTVGWNSSKIISPLVNLVSSLFATPTRRVYSKGNTPEIFARIGAGCWKSGFRRTKALISLKRGKIRPRLLLRSNRKSYTRFRLVPKSMTLDDLEGSLCALFQNTCVFRSSPWKFEWRWIYTVSDKDVAQWL